MGPVMVLSYAFKRVIRSWQIFTALLIGIILASAFFTGVNIKADVTAKRALDQSLSKVHVDIIASIRGASPTLAISALQKILSIEGVKSAEVISAGLIWQRRRENGEVTHETIRLVGIRNDSHLYQGWLNKPPSMGENETYIVKGSPIAKKLGINDVITLNISISSFADSFTVQLNLKVKGIAELDEKSYAIASGNYRTFNGFIGFRDIVSTTERNILLVDWDKTLTSILELASSYPYGSPLSTEILIYVDRETLIDHWDIDGSIQRISNLRMEVENEIPTSIIYNNLESPLVLYRSTALFMRFAFIVVSLPIFFMAWYVGTTVSDVSFNLRRREIGLLLTKGFSRKQLLSIFLTETLLIGVLGGALGGLLGFLLNPLFTGENQFAMYSSALFNIYTMAFAVIFGVIIAFLSAFNSARKASKLPTVDALREYLYVEEPKTYRSRWPVLALILGTYKMMIFLLGINVVNELMKLRPGNFIVMLLFSGWIVLDWILNLIGPLLFFWGFTKIFIQGSLKFQEFTSRIAQAFTDLSVLATNNIRRNPARTMAIAFLLALIIGYSVQVVGQLASEEDFITRKIYAEVGADISVHLSTTRNASFVMEQIIANFSEKISNSTLERSFSINSAAGTITLRAVEPYSWLKTAYYEREWFSGNDASKAFEALAKENNTIILERTIARNLNLEVGDQISLNIGNSWIKFKVVGFFGPEVSEEAMYFGVNRFWSFISEKTYEKYTFLGVSSRILLKLKDRVNGTAVAEQIREMKDLGVTTVECVEELLKEAYSNALRSGIWDTQRLGIVFAVLAASVGTALISIVSMKERNREAAIMSVRGLSYKQMLIVFLTESLAIVIFAAALGSIVGLITVYGYVSATHTQSVGLVMRRIVLPLPAAILLFSCIALIFISTILPITLMCRRYFTKLEKVIRIR
jgi:ABC-type antimicrobial peptide transport system permease subunit